MALCIKYINSTYVLAGSQLSYLVLQFLSRITFQVNSHWLKANVNLEAIL